MSNSIHYVSAYLADIKLTVETIVTYYKTCFQMKFLLRDAKQQLDLIG